MILRLLLAIIVGGLIGYEREHTNQPAGFRTHILVCIGAAVISMIRISDVFYVKSQITLDPNIRGIAKVDFERLAAQVVSGIGFLGAGTIIHDKGSVRGLTTAASIWVVACIGLAVGMGYYFLSIFSTIAVLLVLITLKRIENKFFKYRKTYEINIEYNDENFSKPLEALFRNMDIKIKDARYYIQEDKEKYNFCKYKLMIPDDTDLDDLIEKISNIKGVNRILNKQNF